MAPKDKQVEKKERLILVEAFFVKVAKIERFD